MKTKAIPPDRLLKYLLNKDEELLKDRTGLVVYQRDLVLAINAIRKELLESSIAMVQLTTLLSSVIVFPSEPYKPTLEEVKKLRGEVE